MDRITTKQLEALVAHINKLTGNPEKYIESGKILVGHFHLDFAYGGVMLCQTINASGGVTCPLGNYHGTKRALYERISSFISGLEYK